jgi:hypothetical protein
MIDTILGWLKRLGIGGGILALLGYVIFFAYSLPSHIKVHVTGTEVTREDVKKRDGEVRTSDVRFVMVEDLDGEAHMFRNQDTGWGWPPYFKFDEGDVAAQANNYAVDRREDVVLVKYYGFRIRVLSTFPNIISMRTVPPDYQPIPWFTIIFVFANVALIGAMVVLFRDLTNAGEDNP